MGKVLGFASALVVALGHFAADFNGHLSPVDFDGDLHRISSCSDLDFAKSERRVGNGSEAGY